MSNQDRIAAFTGGTDELGTSVDAGLHGRIKHEILFGEYEPGDKLKVDAIKKRFSSGANAVREALGIRGESISVDPRSLPQLVAHFERHDVGDDSFRWTLHLGSGGLTARLDWRRGDLGETPAELARPSSTLSVRLRGDSPASEYYRFYVWSDSFEAYLAARRFVEERGFAAGWIPIDANEELEGSLFAGPRVEYPIPVD